MRLCVLFLAVVTLAAAPAHAQNQLSSAAVDAVHSMHLVRASAYAPEPVVKLETLTVQRSWSDAQARAAERRARTESRRAEAQARQDRRRREYERSRAEGEARRAQSRAELDARVAEARARAEARRNQRTQELEAWRAGSQSWDAAIADSNTQTSPTISDKQVAALRAEEQQSATQPPVVQPPLSGTARSYSSDLQMRASTSTPSTPVSNARSAPATFNSTQVRESLEQILLADSAGWAFNSYDTGSVTNARLISDGETGSTAVQGDYTYNGGSRGWIRANISNGRVECIIYHDYPSRCRPVGDYSYQSGVLSLLVAAAVTGAANPSTTSTIESSASDRMRERRQRDAQETQDAWRERQQDRGCYPSGC